MIIRRNGATGWKRDASTDPELVEEEAAGGWAEDDAGDIWRLQWDTRQKYWRKERICVGGVSLN